MEKQAVIYLRDRYKEKGLPIEIICDNMIRYFDNTNNRNSIKLMWDDEREILTEFRMNGENTNQKIHPIRLSSVQYSEIQYIDVFLDPETAVEYLKEIKDVIGQDDYDKGLELLKNATL